MKIYTNNLNKKAIEGLSNGLIGAGLAMSIMLFPFGFSFTTVLIGLGVGVIIFLLETFKVSK